MNAYDAISILRNVKYKDWEFFVSGEPDFYLQVRFLADGERQHCRKWRLSQYMTKSELVQTALKAVLAAEEHEAREKFLFKNARIFGPHLDVEKLVEMAGEVEVRPNGRSNQVA